MTILDNVTQANVEANLPDFSFCEIDEFQKFVDSFKAADGAIHVIRPFEEQGTWIGGRRKAIVPIEGWVLTLLKEESVDFRSAAIENTYLQPMRKLAKQFLWKLMNTDMVDDEVKEIRDVISPEYAFTQQRLFGVRYRIQLPILEGVEC